MGSGKTTIGKLLHNKLERTALVSTDAIKFFISDFERGERDNKIAAAVLMQMCKEYIKNDINLLIPQGFWKKEYLDPYIQLAEENDLELHVYQLVASRETLLARIKERPISKFAKTPVPEDRIIKNLTTWEENRYGVGKVFNTEELNPEQVAQLILEDLS